MNDDFRLVQDIVTGTATGRIAPASSCHATSRRLFRAAQALIHRERYAPGPADLAVLARHALRCEQELQAGVSPTLAVPNCSAWPSADALGGFGFEVIHANSERIAVRARCWTPSWLAGAAETPPDRAPCAEDSRRDYGDPLAGDPFLDKLQGFETYRSAGQREAIRSLRTSPESSTLVVNLPTGAGKSFCAYLTSLLDPAGLSVLVVPTTTLALDQERATERFFLHPTAYFGATDRNSEQRNREIRTRISEGTQRIVFTSPESLVRSLAGPLYTVAARGSLRLLAVDEAHIVDQWGDDFRPEFQELAGLRRDLLRRADLAPFRTLLMTGTLTESCLDTLETLFGTPGPFGILSSVQIRPEPSYWANLCSDEDFRRERVLNSVRHLPRPLVLYVSKVEDAASWASLLRSVGFNRLATVTGTTRTSERSEVIRAWNAGDLDLVVATSAFGLGMDKEDVRAVVHACLPEHIDRFYQEVGRGGRDGKACVSLLLYTAGDVDTARRISKKSLITSDDAKENKGYGRWKKMFSERCDLGDGRTRVPINVVPEYAFGRFENNPYSVAWNVHTLILLARAGVIELDAQQPPTREHFASDDGTIDEEKLNREYERHRNERIIRIINEGHLDLDKTWHGSVERAREKSERTNDRGLALMLEAAHGGRCLAGVFAETYEIPPRTGANPRAGVLISGSCGGCAKCRRESCSPFAGGMPIPLPVWGIQRIAVPDQLTRLFGSTPRLFIFDDLPAETSGGDRQRRERLFRHLTAQGFRSIYSTPNELERLRPIFQSHLSPVVFFNEVWEPIHFPRTPTLIYRPPYYVLARILSAARTPIQELPQILWIPSDTRDPEKPHCLLAHTAVGATYTLDEFITRLEE